MNRLHYGETRSQQAVFQKSIFSNSPLFAESFTHSYHYLLPIYSSLQQSYLLFRCLLHSAQAESLFVDSLLHDSEVAFLLLSLGRPTFRAYAPLELPCALTICYTRILAPDFLSLSLCVIPTTF